MARVTRILPNCALFRVGDRIRRAFVGSRADELQNVATAVGPQGLGRCYVALPFVVHLRNQTFDASFITRLSKEPEPKLYSVLKSGTDLLILPPATR